MEVANTKLEMPKWVCVLGIALGAVALAVQAFVDCYQSVSPDMDRAAFWAQVWQMVLPTGFTLVFAAMSGGLLRIGRWFVASLLFILVVGYMAYTATNSMDFLSNQTVARTQAHMAKQVQSKDIAEIKNKLAMDERKERTDNLWRTYMNTKGVEKDKVLAEIKAASQEAVTIERPDLEVAPVGVGGTAHRYLGWRPEAIQEAKAVAYPILVMIGKMLGITLGFAFYPSPSPERWKASRPGKFPDHTFPESKWKVSYEMACEDMLSMLASGGRAESQRELANRWRVTEGQVSKWLPKMKRDGIPIKLEINGNKRAIVPAHQNGSGRVLGNA
jgi:hypothetical protein